MDDEDGDIPLAVFPEASNIARWFTTVMTKFARVHKHINHGRKMTDQEISDAGMCKVDNPQYVYMFCLSALLYSLVRFMQKFSHSSLAFFPS